MYTRHFVRLENAQKEYYPEPAFVCLFEISYTFPPATDGGRLVVTETALVDLTLNILTDMLLA